MQYWLRKFAEDYGGGSSGSDFLNTQDGSETLQNGINTNEPSNGDGQGAVPDYGKANHPYTPLGEQGYEMPAEDDDMPAPVADSDDNHADGGFGVGSVASSGALLSIFRFGKVACGKCGRTDYDDIRGRLCDRCAFGKKKASDTRPESGDRNFFLQDSTSGGVADSPETMSDGHPREDLSVQEGMENVINNTPHPTNEPDASIFRDKTLVDPDQHDESPDLNKGRLFAHLTFVPFLAKSINPFAKKADSNLDDVMYPDEERIKEDQSKHDFGTGDQYANDRGQGDAPMGGGQLGSETETYSGVDTTAGLLGIIMKKKAWGGAGQVSYGPVTPSSNPNSGISLEDVEQNRDVMTDGKNSTDNIADKEWDDPTQYRKKLKYNKTEDTEDYYNVSGTSSGFGGEGDGQNFSGIDNS